MTPDAREKARHKASVMIEYAEGKEIQIRLKESIDQKWWTDPSPQWRFSEFDYRVKPEERTIEKLTSLLAELGWIPSGDAQWENLEAGFPRLREILFAQNEERKAREIDIWMHPNGGLSNHDPLVMGWTGPFLFREVLPSENTGKEGL